MDISVIFAVFLIKNPLKKQKNAHRKGRHFDFGTRNGNFVFGEYPFGLTLTSKLDALYAEDANPIPLFSNKNHFNILHSQMRT